MVTDLKQLDLSKQYTYADYLTWKLKERVELLKGFIHKMSPAPNRQHQVIARNTFLSISNSLKKEKCEVYFAPFDVRLSNEQDNEKTFTVVQPDICIICDESKLDYKGCLGAPDMIVEILSPGNTQKEMKAKFDLYEEAGVIEYLIIDPEHHSILQFKLIDKVFTSGRPLTTTDILTSHAIKDLEVSVEEVFKS